MEPFKKQGREEKWLAHLVAATRTSLDGFKVLMQEQAARHEIIAFIVVIVLFAISGASFVDYLVLGGLFMWILCTEALNTAIELIVDKTSPERSDYARMVKDLGSFAVCCTQIVLGGYVLWVLFF